MAFFPPIYISSSAFDDENVYEKNDTWILSISFSTKDQFNRMPFMAATKSTHKHSHNDCAVISVKSLSLEADSKF